VTGKKLVLQGRAKLIYCGKTSGKDYRNEARKTIAEYIVNDFKT
jgi:hypothetical protein